MTKIHNTHVILGLGVQPDVQLQHPEDRGGQTVHRGDRGLCLDVVLACEAQLQLTLESEGNSENLEISSSVCQRTGDPGQESAAPLHQQRQHSGVGPTKYSSSCLQTRHHCQP